MKKIYWIVITAWSVYAFINHKDLRPSDDYYLVTLCAVSTLLSAIGMIELWCEKK